MSLYELVTFRNSESQNLITRGPLSQNTFKSFKDRRDEEKMGKFFSQCLIFKLICCVYFISMPHLYSQVGICLGAIIMLIIFYCNWYNSRLICDLANEIEQKKNINIDSYSHIIDDVFADNHK